jgi:hypothetical protein
MPLPSSLTPLTDSVVGRITSINDLFGGGAPGGLVDQVNQGFQELEQHEMLAREKRLDPEERYVPYRLLTREQAEQWERSFDSDPRWRLNKGEYPTWSYSEAPNWEKLSPANQQLAEAMEDVTNKVDRMIKPSLGPYSPDYIPMRGSGYGRPEDWATPIHYDPSQTGQGDLAASPLPQAQPGALPSPPTIDPPSRLMDEMLQGTLAGAGLAPEQLSEVREHPGSLKSMATYAQWLGIMMGGGKGRYQPRFGKPGAVPGHIWDSWKVVQEPVMGNGGEVIRPAIRMDEAGNHYEYQGSHMVGTEQFGAPYAEQYHAIVKPVGAPGSGEEYYQKFQEEMQVPPEQMTGDPKKVELRQMLQKLNSQQDLYDLVQLGKQAYKPQDFLQWDQLKLKDFMDQVKIVQEAYPEAVLKKHLGVEEPPQHPPPQDAEQKAYWEEFGKKHEEAQVPDPNELKHPPPPKPGENPPMWDDLTPGEQQFLKNEYGSEMNKDSWNGAMAKWKEKYMSKGPHMKWEDLSDDLKRQYPDPEKMTNADWEKVREYQEMEGDINKPPQPPGTPPPKPPPEEPPDIDWEMEGRPPPDFTQNTSDLWWREPATATWQV